MRRLGIELRSVDQLIAHRRNSQQSVMGHSR